MREIKFRAWDGIDMEYFHDLYWFEENQVRSSNDYKYKIMQFIGVRDKNGKEIYEGDWIKACEGVGKVIFQNGAFFMDFNPKDSQEPNQKVYFFNLVAVGTVEIEVIGNIYENQELVGEGNLKGDQNEKDH